MVVGSVYVLSASQVTAKGHGAAARADTLW